MKTVLLYHRDSFLFDAEASVVAHGSFRGAPSVVLDETIFYPEAGGQLADRGTLAGVAVRDVQIDDDGVVHHFLDGVAPEVGARVSLKIDRARRRQFMAQHTGQHMLSRALLDVAMAETVSARLGESVSTIDVDVPALVERDLAEAEEMVNTAIDDDLTIRAWFPDEAELRALPLRRQPKVADNVRVVEIGDARARFDVSPCGGTHCARTSQVGFVRVVGVERYKGMMRVSFMAGAQGRAQVFSRAKLLEEMARSSSTSPEEMPAALQKLRAELKAAREESSALVDVAGVHAARVLAAGATSPVVALIEGGTRILRAVGAALADVHRLDAILGTNLGSLDSSDNAGGVAVLVVRAPGSTMDCGAVLKKITQAGGGKGGGKPERAEGRLPAGADLVLLARAALS